MSVATDKDIGQIRNPIDVQLVERFFRQSAESVHKNKQIIFGPQQSWPIVKGPFEIRQFKYGQSNPTYLVTDKQYSKKYTLRRKPTANSKLFSKKAHNIEREFYIGYDIENLNLTQGFAVPVAKPILLCEDENQIGYVFYMSEFVQGHIFHDPYMSALSDEKRIQLWQSVLQALVQIHSLPVDKLTNSFAGFRKSRSSYFPRQVKSLGAIEKLQSEQDKTPHIAKFEEISQYLLQNAPKDPEEPVLIHGDFKIDNFIFDVEHGKVLAILDWELCTIGNPLFDLANLLQSYSAPPELSKFFFNTPGKPDDQFVHWALNYYTKKASERANTSLARWVTCNGTCDSILVQFWKYGKVFGAYRVAVIIQGIHARAMNGTASSGDASRYLHKFDGYSLWAWRMISGNL